MAPPQGTLKVVIEGAVVPSLRPAYEMLAALVDPGRTVVVGSSWSLAAHLLGETHGVPFVMSHLQPMAFRSVHRAPRVPGLPLPDAMPAPLKRAAYRLMDLIVDPLLCPPLNALRASLGLGPVRRVFQNWIHEADLVQGFFPDWFGPPQPDWPTGLRLCGFPLWDEGGDTPLDDELEQWLEDGTAPIVFSAGSAYTAGARFFAASAEAAARLGQRAILVTRHAEDLPDPLPEGVRHAFFPPFSKLYPRAKAAVHHGGIGTTALALASGLPALVVPMAFDQPDNASRLVDLGAGAVIPMARYTARRAVHALDRLLKDTRAQAACRQAADRLMIRNALAIAADQIESLGVR